MVERVHFCKDCLLQLLQFMVASVEACLSDFYLAATGVYIWIPFSETGSTDIPCVAYVCEFLVSRVTKEDYGAPVLGCTFWAAVASPASCFVYQDIAIFPLALANDITPLCIQETRIRKYFN